MTQTPYTPKPGSVAYRVIAWLETHTDKPSEAPKSKKGASTARRF